MNMGGIQPMMTSIQATRSIAFGCGIAQLDAQTGAPTAFVCHDCVDRDYLLPLSVPWHSQTYEWGNGSIVTDQGSVDWEMPSRIQWTDNGQTLDFDLPSTGLKLEVCRRGGRRLTETYTWVNETDRPVKIRSLQISTPFNDRYPSAKESLATCVNTHIFACGTCAWVYAEPMDGSAPGLGLTVTHGAINSYSIETRTSSNYRGHILLNVTDSVVSPHSFGGQPIICVPIHGIYRLQWEIGWYQSREEFLAHNPQPMRFSRLSTSVGNPIMVTTPLHPTSPDRRLHIVRQDKQRWELHASEPGIYRLIFKGSDNDNRESNDDQPEQTVRIVTEVLFFEPLVKVIRKRVSYILSHQVSSARPGALSGALVAVDTRNGLPCLDPQWNDWTDGSERIGMAVLLQKAINHGLLSPSLQRSAQEECDKWALFCREALLDGTGASRRGSDKPVSSFGTRLYDAPWISQFYCEHYQALHHPEDLQEAEKVLCRYFELGGEHFLAIGLSQTLERTSRLLEENGEVDKAQRLRTHLIDSARYFLKRGRDLPPHEVSYEQSIVAPLISLLIEAFQFTHDKDFLDGARQRLPWLLSFSGFQPDARLYGIAIRHWDDAFFGIERSYGDVFPHYWSALTAQVLAEMPDNVITMEHRRLITQILEADMANYFADGSATSAFVFPSDVDHRAMNHADPMANDQDWHLNIWLDLIERGKIS